MVTRGLVGESGDVDAVNVAGSLGVVDEVV
jgi:hypothetical protein